MHEHYLAFDLGAGSGRAMLGTLTNDQQLTITELHRFPNEMIKQDDGLHWDVERLSSEILKALQVCAKKHTERPNSIGLDTWGVDFGLLDQTGALINQPHTYRDARTESAIEEFTSKIDRYKIYQLTGIQLLPFNTLFNFIPWYAMARQHWTTLPTSSSCPISSIIF